MFLRISGWALFAVALFFLTLFFGPIMPALWLIALLVYATARLAGRAKRQPWMHSGLPLIAFVLIVLHGTTAFAASIDIGQALNGSLQEIINGVVTALIAAFVALLSYLAQKYFKITIAAGHRDVLTAFLQRQASSLVAQGAVKLEGVKIEVDSQPLADAANQALAMIPGALAFFGLTPAKLQQMIVDLIPKQPAVAQAQAVALDVANPATPSGNPA